MSDIEEIKKKKEDLIKLYLVDSNKPKKYWVNLSVYNNQIIDKLTKEVEGLERKVENIALGSQIALQKAVGIMNDTLEENTKLREQQAQNESTIYLLKEQLKESEDKMQEVGNALKMDYSLARWAYKQLLTKNK